MYIERRNLSPQKVALIARRARLILLLVLSVLTLGFWSMQILQYRRFLEQAHRNMFRQVDVRAPRGLIMDRNRQVMAENKLNFNLFLVRDRTRDLDHSLNAAARLTGMDKEVLVRRVEKFRSYPGSYPIPLRKALPLERVIYLKSRADRYPEFEVDVDPARHYPFGVLGAHILGYMAEIGEAGLQEYQGQGYRLGDEVGVTGIERRYERVLRGTLGSQQVVCDNQGRVVEVVDEVKPRIGKSLILTVDLDLQRRISGWMEGMQGTVGVLDLKTGGLLAVVSKPDYDPSVFVGRLDADQWEELSRDPSRPLRNRFIQGRYSPGSTFKTVVALAALSEGAVTAEQGVFCTGSVRIYDRVFHCWRPGGHGWVDLPEALRDSCNVYFYLLGKKLEIDVLASYANKLGMGELTGIDLPNENPGLVPTTRWKQEVLHQKWFPGETISVAIGGGMLGVTPAQCLVMISTVALRGLRPRIHLVRQIESEGGPPEQVTPSFVPSVIDRSCFEPVVEGLWRVVNGEGTGRAAGMDGFDVCGKTGTQQIISKENPNYQQLVKQERFRPHAWFVSFAPRINPRYAMVVFVEHGGEAGGIAAPLAGKIYRYLFHAT